jgi:hypothetical protein
MAVKYHNFAEAQNKSVDKQLAVGGWQVYPSYEIWEYEEEHEGEKERFPFVRAAPVQFIERTVPEDSPAYEAGYRSEVVPDWSDVEVYAPLGVDDLFVQFAQLFGNSPADAFAPETTRRVLDWIEGYGVLGRYGTYPTPDGGTITDRFDDREEIMIFVARAVEANRCLQLFGAATEPGGPNVEKLRDLDVKGATPEQMKERALAEVVDTTDKHLESETFTRLYRSRDDSKLFRGPGFHSLLGAMWLQMSNLLTAPEENIRRCRWCGDIITFEAGEPPPSDAPKGTRGKHKTHKNRDFCKQKHGVKDWCKNQWNYSRHKRLSAMGAEDAKRNVHMRESRPGEWMELQSGEKKAYDKGYRGTRRLHKPHCNRR